MKQARDVATVGAIEIGNKIFDAPRFLTKVSRGADELSQFLFGQSAQCGKIERPCTAKIRDGALHVLPGCVLCEKCTENDFEAGSTRPPVLRPVAALKREVDGADQPILGFSLLVSRKLPAHFIGPRKFYELPALI